mgnify:FL=1|tara:strand:+ start:903 stop:2000 length:1098 start_codon:yes stop_codon:yes gene_type:complete
MAIKASGGNPPSNSLSFTEIENEFGQNASRSLGDYRMNNLNIGALTEVSLSRDGCGISANSNIPVDDQEIKFSDFFSAKQNIILDFHSNNQNRVNAKNDKYNASSPSGNYTVVGSAGNSKPSSTNGKKVIIHVTKVIGSSQGNVNNVALRTGNWDSGTELLVEVDGGTVIGAGGNGGNGQSNNVGTPGTDGTSGLGIDYSGTKIQTAENGLIACGFGGGGAGGGARTKREGSSWGGGRGPTVNIAGSGGGGGQGAPGGSGGSGGANGTAGDHEQAGEGGPETEAESVESGVVGGNGGEGGHTGDASADAGEAGSLNGSRHEDPNTAGGGIGGGNGAAIRKASGSISFTLIGSPNISGDTTATNIS